MAVSVNEFQGKFQGKGRQEEQRVAPGKKRAEKKDAYEFPYDDLKLLYDYLTKQENTTR